ncbi:MAG: hypothetical protein ACM3N5_05855 [Candidatus Eiseniibacteriota bacterium]
MGARRSGIPLGTLALLALCAALGGLVYVELGREPPPLIVDRNAPTAGAPSKDAVRPAQEPAAFRPAPLAAYGEVVARPLFNRTRRPIADKAEGPLAGGPGGPPLRLIGIVVDADGPTAFLKMKDGPKILRVKQGGTVEGWTVESIDGNSVTLARGGDVARLSTKNEQSAEERADRSAAKRKPGMAGGRQGIPGQKRDENRD